MLLDPKAIHEVLKNENRPRTLKTENELERLLENANLSKEEVLENLSLLMRSGETDGVRVRAAETALKLNGLLNNDKSDGQNFSVNIIIRDSEYVELNPILYPR